MMEGKAIIFVERSHLIPLEMYGAFEALSATIIGPIPTSREVALLLDFLQIDVAVVDNDLSDDGSILRLFQDYGVPSFGLRRAKLPKWGERMLPP